MICWLCLGGDDVLIEPCSSCSSTIHESCLAAYQNQPHIDSNRCGACRSWLKPERRVEPLRVFEFDFDSYEVVKTGDLYEIVGRIGLFKFVHRIRDHRVLVRVALKPEPIRFVDVPSGDFVFSDEEIESALLPWFAVDKRVVLRFNAVAVPVAEARSVLSAIASKVRRAENLVRGSELKRASAERRAAVAKRRSQEIV